jgi:hypothetical protein
MGKKNHFFSLIKFIVILLIFLAFEILLKKNN